MINITSRNIKIVVGDKVISIGVRSDLANIDIEVVENDKLIASDTIYIENDGVSGKLSDWLFWEVFMNYVYEDGIDEVEEVEIVAESDVEDSELVITWECSY